MNKNTKNSVEDSHVVKPQGGVTELTTPTCSESKVVKFPVDQKAWGRVMKARLMEIADRL